MTVFWLDGYVDCSESDRDELQRLIEEFLERSGARREILFQRNLWPIAGEESGEMLPIANNELTDGPFEEVDDPDDDAIARGW